MIWICLRLKWGFKKIVLDKLQLKLITIFTNDICMQFGKNKCTYIYIEEEQQATIKSAEPSTTEH